MNTAKRKRLKLDGWKTQVVDEDSDKRKGSLTSNLSVGTEIGFSVATPVVGGVLLGVFLDKKFNLAPKLTLSFLFLGVIIGFINIFKIVNENK